MSPPDSKPHFAPTPDPLGPRTTASPKPSFVFRLLQIFSTLFLTTLLAFGAWIYAAEQTRHQYEAELVSVSIALRGEHQAELSPANIQTEISFSASRAQYDAFRRALQDTSIPLTVSFDPEKEGLQTSQLDLTKGLRDWLDGEMGIRLLATDRPSVDVQIDPMVAVTLPVEVVAENLDLNKPPAPDPAELTFRLPASKRDRLPPNATAWVRLSEAQIAPLPRGIDVQLQVQAVPTGLPQTPGLPVNLTLQRSIELPALPDIEIDRKPIVLGVTQSLQQRFRFELPEDNRFVRELKLAGSNEETLLDNIRCVVWIMREDQIQQDDQGLFCLVSPEVILPTGLTLISSQVPAQIRVAVIPLATPATP